MKRPSRSDLHKKMLLVDEYEFYRDKMPLAQRIDYAWEICIEPDEKKHPKVEKDRALNFLIYAFDLPSTQDIAGQVQALMNERNKHKEKNPDYIPGKSFTRLPFDPAETVPKQTPLAGQTSSPQIMEAFKRKELLDVNNISKRDDRQSNTIFLDAEARALHRINIREGLLTQHNSPVNTSRMISHGKKGFAAYTINANGEISIFDHIGMKDGMAHSSMNAGAPVVAAGELNIQDGKLIAITTHSGHYAPSLFNVARALEYFNKHGVDISSTKVITQNDPSKQLSGVESESWLISAYPTPIYVTPATQIYKSMKQLITENVIAINKEVAIYNEGGILTTLYNMKDKLTGSSLTKDRSQLAERFKQEILAFQEGLNDTSPQHLPAKMKELESVIAKFERDNNLLSTNANKEVDSGRLSSTAKQFKKSLDELKTEGVNQPTTQKNTY